MTGMRKNSLIDHLEHGQSEDNDITRLLFAAGETLDTNYLKEQEDLHQLMDVRMQLKCMCREAIRSHLLNLDSHHHHHLFNRIPHLGLPEIITQYLCTMNH